MQVDLGTLALTGIGETLDLTGIGETLDLTGITGPTYGPLAGNTTWTGAADIGGSVPVT